MPRRKNAFFESMRDFDRPSVRNFILSLTVGPLKERLVQAPSHDNEYYPGINSDTTYLDITVQGSCEAQVLPF
jgi:hypothetical protein